MALVFDAQLSGPQTHAFVIGVGGYTYLDGGSAANAALAAELRSLGQLNSPPRSALAFADWLESVPASGWNAPLGSIELLVSVASSDPDPRGDGSVFQAATRQNVRDAYRAWRNRCDADADNVAILFFCGHGLSKDEHYLLCEDFGEDAGMPWEGAFAFDSTRDAFHSCASKTQCFFIDACRKVTAGMLTNRVTALPLEVPSALSAECLHDLTVKATAHTEGAFGTDRQPSHFTNALLRALGGGASQRRGPRWRVSTGELATKLNMILRLIDPQNVYPQRCTQHTTASNWLLETESCPDVHLSVECEPSSALEVAHLACGPRGGTTQWTRAPAPGVWKLQIPAGTYDVAAAFPGGEYQPASDEIWAEPPLTEWPLRCTP